jgi:hypothetical protein
MKKITTYEQEDTPFEERGRFSCLITILFILAIISLLIGVFI